jgi:hypothetical protein
MRTKDKPGLKSVYEGREARLQGRFNRPTASILIYALVGAAAVLLVYRFVYGRQLESSREALLSKVRAAKVSVGAEWTPLRDNLENITTSAAGAYENDMIAPDARTWDFRAKPGLYLRVRVAQAKAPAEVREAARYSVKDAFTGCLLRSAQGAPPREANQEPESDTGVFPEQPWNLKQAYQTTRILTPEWEAEVRDAQDDVRLRVFQEQYDRAQKKDLPLVIDILKKADFYLLALDEDVDEAKTLADGGTVTVSQLQQLKHPVRVFLFDLKSKKLMLRVRRSAEAGLMLARGTMGSAETQAAMQRQVNNCALAQEVNRFIEGK